MQHMIYDWLGHDWVALRAEGLPNLDVAGQTSEIFRRFDADLNRIGLSLADTMRTRLWARAHDSPVQRCSSSAGPSGCRWEPSGRSCPIPSAPERSVLQSDPYVTCSLAQVRARMDWRRKSDDESELLEA